MSITSDEEGRSLACPHCGEFNRLPIDMPPEACTCYMCAQPLVAHKPKTSARAVPPTQPQSVVLRTADGGIHASAVPDDPQVSPRIALVGTEGSGKTVLITTLANRFKHVDTDGAALRPLDRETMLYVERNWSALSAGEWPAGTPLGQRINLRWSLECGGDRPIRCEIRSVDAAGQDLRRLFGGGAVGAQHDIPAQLQELYSFCSSADIVIVLLNMRDFLGEGNQERLLDNRVVITFAIQQLAADPTRRLCLLFTQFDQYEATLRQRYKNDVGRFLAHHLPYIDQRLFATQQLIIHAVAAVNNTTTVTKNGTMLRVPQRHFSARGYETFMGWLVEQAQVIVARRQAELVSLRQENVEAQTESFWEILGKIALAMLGAWILELLGCLPDP